jgi:hypothetical protein
MLDVLPDNYDFHPINWSDDVWQYSQGTGLHEFVTSVKASLKKSFDHITSVLAEASIIKTIIESHSAKL